MELIPAPRDESLKPAGLSQNARGSSDVHQASKAGQFTPSGLACSFSFYFLVFNFFFSFQSHYQVDYLFYFSFIFLLFLFFSGGMWCLLFGC